MLSYNLKPPAPVPGLWYRANRAFQWFLRSPEFFLLVGIGIFVGLLMVMVPQ